ncbi:TniQ family protein [Streptomyces sp. NPDC001393]
MVSASATRQLPRALVPLPDESLPGLLLRLSYRLERAPHRIAVLCGLEKGYRVPAYHLLRLSDALTSQVGNRLRLSAAETESLTLRSLTDTYLPLASMPSGARLTNPTSGMNWSFNLSSRFCPRCLHGDESSIQRTLGGPWRLRWHLPTTFACPKHHQLLASKCPACGQLVNGFTDRHGGLICNPGVPGLHPLQCRNIIPSDNRPRRGGKAHILPCGTRLDRGPAIARFGLSNEDTNLLVALQQRMDKNLEYSGLGAPRDNYLPDLILATVLIKLSWPLGSTLLPSETLKASLDAHAAPISALAAAQRDHPNSGTRLAGPRNLPQEVAHCGALLLAAEKLLGDRDAASLREQVQPFAQAAHKQAPRYLLNLMASISTSTAMARAAARRPHGFPEAPARRSLVPQGTFQLKNVPPFLPEPWFDAHFTGFMRDMPRTNPWTVRQLRRGATLRLAELASGMPWYRCTATLGIPNKAARGTISLLGRELGPAHLWPSFEARVAAIARQLSEENNPTDYSRRLHALAGWRLPLDDWMALCDLPLIGRLRAKEDAAPGTVFVWSESTSAEYLHSPLIQELKRSGESTVPMKRAAADIFAPGRPTGDRRRLRQRLKMYAAQLTHACDLGQSLRVDVEAIVARESKIEQERVSP